MLLSVASFCLVPTVALASVAEAGPKVGGIPAEFLLFVATLAGVALFHHHTLRVALAGMATILVYKLALTDFHLVSHLQHEWVTLVNLFGLLVGFSLLANHFEESGVPGVLPRFLPDDWKGGFVLLLLVAVLSGFLDNIAAAMIGGTIAGTVFRKRVHIGYLAAIVAASNAGGAGSVVGDTTTTMMWIAGKSPLVVVEAYLAAIPAVLISGVIGSWMQHRYQPISKDEVGTGEVDWGRVGVVGVLLGSAVATNVVMNAVFPQFADAAPFLAIALWAAILVTAPFRHTAWHLVPEAARGSVFLLALVMCASMMPVSELPPATWQTALGLGFVSSVFDNIPLTALALKQGGYDWGFLAFAVGYGGSMVWFGSSAGVALSNAYPEAKNAIAYLRHGWHVPLAYVVSFFVLLGVLGWHPEVTVAPPPIDRGGAPVVDAPGSTGH